MTQGPYQPQQPPPGQQPPYGAGGYGMAPYGMPPPTSSKATTSLVLGIVSIFACGLLLGIPAMIIGRQAKREIQESQGRLGGEGFATAGFVTGLIGTIWSVLAGLVVILLLVFGLAFAQHASRYCTTTTDQDGNPTIHCSSTG